MLTLIVIFGKFCFVLDVKWKIPLIIIQEVADRGCLEIGIITLFFKIVFSVFSNCLSMINVDLAS